MTEKYICRFRMTKIYQNDETENLFRNLQPLFVILILPLALLMKNLKKGCGAPAMQIYFSDSSKAHFFSRVRMTKIYFCTSAVPPPFCPSDIFPVSSGKFTVKDDKNISE